MSAGTYIHSGPDGYAFDGVPEGSSLKRWACDSREIGHRALMHLNQENKGDQFDRYVVLRKRIKRGETR